MNFYSIYFWVLIEMNLDLTLTLKTRRPINCCQTEAHYNLKIGLKT